jgi:2-hydroxy-6-oxonona-2,4-dienedioate hydrolase
VDADKEERRAVAESRRQSAQGCRTKTESSSSSEVTMLRRRDARPGFHHSATGLIAAFLLLPALAVAQFQPSMPPEKAVILYGQSIHYYEAGQGPNLIFLHGLGGDATNWAPNIGPLAEKYHVYGPDQIGFGNSAKPLVEYRIETFVAFLHAFMQALNIPKATLVGNSLGGWIAADFAARYPEKVDKLVLVDAAGLGPEGPPTPLPVDLNPASPSGMRKVLEFIVYNKQWVTDEIARQAFEQRLKRGDGYTIQRVIAGILAGNQFLDAKVGSIKAPTLVLWGREDALTPLSLGERFQKGIPGAKLTVLDQCGHIPQLEKPLEFNKALLEFLAQP